MKNKKEEKSTIISDNPENQENERPIWLDIDNLTNKLASPVFPYIAIAVSCFFIVVFGKYQGTLTGLAMLLALHVGCYVIEENKMLKIQDIHMRSESSDEPEVCGVCGTKPEVCYLEDVDRFYVRCGKCKIQTEFANTVEEAVENWHVWKGKGMDKEV